MYGLVLENLAEYVKEAYGEDAWENIRREAKMDMSTFSTHQVYPESLVPRLAKTACKVLNVNEQEFLSSMGAFFVQFVGQYGYDRVLSVLGRHVRDFLNGLDNLHEYLKFSYPRMKPPSFFCENETIYGTMLHYRSKRKGYGYYTMGQIKQVARHFYDTDMQIEVIREDSLMDSFQVTFQLTFDNIAFRESSTVQLVRDEQSLPLRADLLFELFPFSIAFTQDLIVRNLGISLSIILPELLGEKLNDWFDIARPIIEFNFPGIMKKTNNIFEMATVDSLSALKVSMDSKQKPGDQLISFDSDEDVQDNMLRLKGQMLYLGNWKMMLFLATPIMPDLDSMIATGLFINDLSMHDFSRDMIMAGTQQSVEMKLALDQEQIKSKKLEASMKKLDEEMQRTDELLYQMIPKQVAKRLRDGANPIDTCEVFDSVTVLFSDVVTFTEICSRITPLQVVSLLNSMYSIFDQLTELNGIYKVETIGDAYMAVGGAPDKQRNHAELTCNMALDMVDGIKGLTDPSTGNHIRVRVGLHSGMVVAGVVGTKMPRYCLFGDTVNTASRMESNSAAMRIHISQTTKELIGTQYQIEERGEVQIKGKGNMKTYWLDSRDGRKPLAERITLEPVAGGDAILAVAPPSAGRRSYTPVTVASARAGSALSAVSARAEDVLRMDTSRLSDIKRARSAVSRTSVTTTISLPESPLLSFPIPKEVINSVEPTPYTNLLSSPASEPAKSQPSAHQPKEQLKQTETHQNEQLKVDHRKAQSPPLNKHTTVEPIKPTSAPKVTASSTTSSTPAANSAIAKKYVAAEPVRVVMQDRSVGGETPLPAVKDINLHVNYSEDVKKEASLLDRKINNLTSEMPAAYSAGVEHLVLENPTCCPGPSVARRVQTNTCSIL